MHQPFYVFRRPKNAFRPQYDVLRCVCDILDKVGGGRYMKEYVISEMGKMTKNITLEDYKEECLFKTPADVHEFVL